MAKHILVVDDEPELELLIRQKFRREIRGREYTFQFASDGLEALERLDEDASIEVVLTDLNMPRMDGLSLLREIQELDRVLKVLVVSAYGDLDNIRAAMNRGAFDFLMKPIDFDDLQATIDKTYQELDTLRQSRKLRSQLSALRRELEIASQIQASVLPSRFPAFPDRDEFDLYATTLPALEVGGDFYDFFLLGDHRLGFSIGDVSGKGVGAALFMAVTRTLLRATALQGLAPAACVRHVNRVLHPESPAHMFVTLCYSVLDLRTGVVTCCTAGHHAPLRLAPDGTVTAFPQARSLALCLADDFEYEASRVVLAPGDSVLLYTDGVTEAAAPDGEQFGEQRLIDTVAEVVEAQPAEAIRHILRAVTTFTGDAHQADDITMLACRYASAARG